MTDSLDLETLMKIVLARRLVGVDDFADCDTPRGVKEAAWLSIVKAAGRNCRRARNHSYNPVFAVLVPSKTTVAAVFFPMTSAFFQRESPQFESREGMAALSPAADQHTTATMTIRPILRYPDPRLALPAQPVTVFDDGLRDLANDLLETMRAAPGIGITAPHIAVSLRVVVLELDPVDGARTYVNPQVMWASPELILHREGSVSMPGVHDEIQRHAGVRIGFSDLDGRAQTEDAEGLRAVCHQHEIDQLDGLFWIQRLSRLKRERLIKRFEKLSRG
jgi:peptide deformylase